jgi:hypothetical protein
MKTKLGTTFTLAALVMAVIVPASVAVAEESPQKQFVVTTSAVPRACLDQGKANQDGWEYVCQVFRKDTVYNAYANPKNYDKEIFTAKKQRLQSSDVAGYFVRQDGKATRKRVIEEEVAEAPAVALVKPGRAFKKETYQETKERNVPVDRWEYVLPGQTAAAADTE